MDLNKERVLITGAQGFVGRAVVQHLAARGRAVRAMCRRQVPHELSGVADCVVADLTTASESDFDAMLAGVTAVVHFGRAIPAIEETTVDQEAVYRSVNVGAAEKLARAAARAGTGRFILSSTVRVNGEASVPGRPFTPLDSPAPVDAYGRSKLASEQALFDACAGTSVAPIVLRLPMIYGPESEGNLFMLFDWIARGRPLPLGSVRNRRSLLYIGNLVEAIDAALDAPIPPRGVHFVADGATVSVAELARAIATVLDVPAKLPHVPVQLLRIGAALMRRGAVASRLVDSLEIDTASFCAATGWQPRHSLADGLAAAAKGWRSRHARQT